MTRKTLFALVLAAACSPKAPAPSETGPQDRSTAATAGGQTSQTAAPLPAPDPREKALATTVVELFEQEHLLRKKIDDGISKEAFKNYLETLDPGKMFLLASDRDALSKYADKIDDELHAGSLELAHEGQKAFTGRIEVVQKFVDELLAKPFDLTNEESVELDSEKLELAKSDDELRERWRQRLELEVLERIASMDARLKADAEKKAGKKDARRTTRTRRRTTRSCRRTRRPGMTRVPTTTKTRARLPSRRSPRRPKAARPRPARISRRRTRAASRV